MPQHFQTFVEGYFYLRVTAENLRNLILGPGNAGYHVKVYTHLETISAESIKVISVDSGPDRRILKLLCHSPECTMKTYEGAPYSEASLEYTRIPSSEGGDPS